MKYLITLLALVSGAAFAGQIPIGWQPVTHPALAGYRLYYGQGNVGFGSPYISLLPTDCQPDASGNCQYMLTDLADCTVWHVSMVSEANDGTLSDWPTRPDGTNRIIKGWPQSVISSIESNEDGVFRILGVNFRPDAVTVVIEGTAVDPLSVSCGEITVTATPGAAISVLVAQPDGTVTQAAFHVPLMPPAQLYRSDVLP